MKRLIASTLTVLTASILLLGGVANAATRFWKVDMSQPVAETSERTLNIAFNVQSTAVNDDFKVVLYENGAAKASQTLTHEYGDSGVFSIDFPENGTYTYEVVASNTLGTADTSDDEPKTSNSETVEVVDGPEPTVTTVVVNTAAADGGAGGGAAGAAADGGVVAGAQAGEGAEDEGQVAGDAATAATEGDDGKVLGAENKDEAGNKSNTGTYIALGVLAAATLGYLFYRFRYSAGSEE